MSKNKIPNILSRKAMGFDVEMGSDGTFHIYRRGRLNALFNLPASATNDDIDKILFAQYAKDLNDKIKSLKKQIKDLTS